MSHSFHENSFILLNCICFAPSKSCLLFLWLSSLRCCLPDECNHVSLPNFCMSTSPAFLSLDYLQSFVPFFPKKGILGTFFLPQSLFTSSSAPATFPLLPSATAFSSFYISAHAFLHLGAGYGAHQKHLHELFFPLHTLAKWELCSQFFSDSRKLCLFWWHGSWLRDAKAPVSKWQPGQTQHPVPVGGQRKQLLVLLKQFFSATGWSVVIISTMLLLCIICVAAQWPFFLKTLVEI